MRFTVDRNAVFEIQDLEHGLTTPEGYVLFKDTPIARIGTQTYLNEELAPDCNPSPDGVIHVERRAEDVFHPDFIASMEGKPIVEDHPGEFLTPKTVREHFRGVTLNVRQGEGTQSDLLLADLLLMDEDAITAARAGKVQISLGYGSEYENLEPGRARQHKMIGNHTAMVIKGRCGPICALATGDSAMAEKDVTKPKSFMGRLQAFFDAEGYKDGETGELTFKDEALASKSGTEQHSSVGSDTHIHIHAGPNGGTTIAPTTDKKSKDKKAKDESGSAEEKEEKEETEDADKDDDKDDDDDKKKSFMDAMSKAYDAEMKKVKDTKVKDKKAKVADADKDKEEDKDDKETKDGDEEEEGEAESEGSVKSVDAEADEEDDKDDKKDNKDKKMKDKKGTKDSAPLKDEFQQLKSDVEILAPGLTLPTFDSAVPQKQTMDSMCLLRRRALAASMKTEEGGSILTMLNGNKALDIKTLTCDAAGVFFNSAVTFARDRNVDTGRLTKAKDPAAKGAPKSIRDFNAGAAAFYGKTGAKKESA